MTYEFNCYEILDVAVTASPEEIRAAYRQASRRHHPDRGGSHAAQIRVNRAYEVLQDPIVRLAHDRYWQIRQSSSAARSHGSARPGGAQTSKATGKSGTRREEHTATVHSLSGLWARIREREHSLARQQVADFEQFFHRASDRFRRARQFRWLWPAGAAVLTLLSWPQPWLWPADLVAWVLALRWLHGCDIAGIRVRFDEANPSESLRDIAMGLATGAAASKRIALAEGARVLGMVESLLSRASTFTHTEETIGRRIAAALFVAGYLPTELRWGRRIILFGAGEERLLVRFRHRPGQTLNVTYVRTMVAEMRLHRATKALLFCTPGLSGNGQEEALAAGIAWYSLERMNEWFGSMGEAGYRGPDGDVLQSLSRLESFLQRITLGLTG